MNQIAKSLIKSKAVHIEPNKEKFFTWTSGKRSPIYCDNRQLISYPEMRKEIIKSFVNYIKEKYQDVELIAGTATAGIPWAAWIASELNLPMIYIRSKPKGHGLKSALEGHYHENQKTIIIEDLISTGKSSIEACTHAKSEGLQVQTVLSIFNYEFPESVQKFEEHKTSFYSLCGLSQLLDYAKSSKLLKKEECELVLNWKNT